ncbi:hypothetical protein [Chamaesiphon sp. OTE_20_metabat_361]|uniref:hypothetical protein n=1 Tax=Chamaesiphon sp. OTE_20_metabat_361 TaxID=2964689 RepID=UPI00286A42A1|nr:hypothetical protein [Chamaesiphon sp. OTE_20_metabat_361]
MTTPISPTTTPISSSIDNKINTEPLSFSTGIAEGLSAAGIPTNGISQTPSAGSKIPCKKGLVTYAY